MENEDMELDVEGVDDDGPSSLGLGIDPNELPSVSSHLSPELSQHPWLTFDEQFNSQIPNVILHDDMDESSRATIHQMIKEEHSYLQTKKFMRCKNKGLKTLFTAKKPTKLSSYNKRWTDEEKDLFKKGIDKHGHNWKEIADMIKTRNRVQVKDFARNYLQNQASKGGQDFSGKCSVKLPESQPSDRLKKHSDDHLLTMGRDDEDGQVTKEDQHLSLDDDEEDVDIDVEETSDTEQTGQGLQSTLLFGDILRHSLPKDNTNLDGHQDEAFILSVKTEQGSDDIEHKTTISKNIPKLEDPQSHSPDRKVKTGIIATDNTEVNIASHVAANVCSSSLLDIKAEHLSSEEDGLTICSLGQETNITKDRHPKKRRRDGKGSMKTMKESSDQECSGDESKALVVTPVSDSVETTQESSLPENMGSGIEHKTKVNERNNEGIKRNKRRGRIKPALVKAEEKMDFETKPGEDDHCYKGYTKVEIKVEKETCDCMEDIKTAVVRNKDYTELCKRSLSENFVTERILQFEQDVTSTADTQHASDTGSEEQSKTDSSNFQSLKGCEENRRLESSHPQVSRDVPSPVALQTSTAKDSQTSDECYHERNVHAECTKEHQDENDNRDRTDRRDHKGEGSTKAGQTVRGDDSDDDGSRIKDQSCEETDEETIELPKEEVTLDPSQVTDGEKEAHPHFFDFNSSAKTPERYLAIRNHIIKCWLKIKPTYLNKTTARSGLKSGGDVNVIGLIHDYLESIGAINFGAYNPSLQKVKKRQNTVESLARRHEPESKTKRLESMRPRRKIFSKDPGDIKEKTTIEKQKRPKSKQPKAPAYDPFKLIDCSKFSSTLPAPFSVKVKGDAIVTMDLHSHLSTTEVIGLLGGHFDPEQSILDIRLARPCRSLSTGMQCEMDPVSQTEACEDIQSAGCRVVGWYHSHPTFSPNPSIRDIETQGHFQEWFSQDAKTPFIGVIVSPYHSRQLVTSKINCLTVSQEWSPDFQCWRPYKFVFSVYQDKDVESSHQQLLSTASHLIAEFALYKYRVEMLWVCPGQSGITYLEKMLKSISTNLCGSEETKSQTVSKLRDLVYDLFGNHCSTVIKDNTLDVTLSFDSSP